MFATRNKSSILPFQHPSRQCQPLGNIDCLRESSALDTIYPNAIYSDLAFKSQQVPFISRTKVHHIQRSRSPVRGPELRRTSNWPHQHHRTSIKEETLRGSVQSATGVEILGQYAELESHLCGSWRVLQRGDDV
jgi:hypothetical protein